MPVGHDSLLEVATVGRDPWLKGSIHCVNRAGRCGFLPLARVISHRSMVASAGRSQRQALAPEPPGQRLNEAVGVELIVEDMGRDAHTIETRCDIDAFARKSIDQP